MAEEQAAQQHAQAGEQPGEGEQTPGQGAGEQQSQGGEQAGGMMRSYSQAGQAGGEGEGEGEGDTFTASSTDDGRPTITTDDGSVIALPDQFWDAENGQVRADSMFKAFRDTKSSHDRLQQERDQLKQQLEQGQQSQQQGTVPDSPEKYEFQPPEGLQREVPSDDPLLQSFRQIAHNNGIPQEQFSKIAGEFMQQMEEQLGPPVDAQAERQKLGPNADTVLEATARWADSLVQDGMLSQEEHDELLSLGETAAGVRALNKLREKAGEQPIPMEGAKVSELPSKQEWYQMVGSEQYQRDPEYRKKVDKMGEQIFGTGPAGSSEPGLGMPG